MTSHRSVARTTGGRPYFTTPAFSGALTAEEVVFCRLYVEAGCDEGSDPVPHWIAAFGADVAARIGPDETAKRAAVLLSRERIRQQIDRQRLDACATLGLTADSLVARMALMALADPRELVRYRRTGCRYCWGEGHQYQYTAREYDQLVASAMDAALKKGLEYVAPPQAGGVGFRRNAEPNPECPECCGEGVGEVHVADMADLSPLGAALFAGAKVTKDGFEIKTHNQLDALKALLPLAGLDAGALERLHRRSTAKAAPTFDDPHQAAEAYRTLMDGDD